MTFERWNLAIRTALLTVLCCAALLLFFRVDGLVTATQESEGGIAAQTSEVLDAAKKVIPATPFDMASLNAATVQAKTLLVNANTTLRKVNAPCGAGAPCGTLADVAKTLNTARMTMGQVEIAANHEDRNLGTLDQQEATIYAGTNADVQALHALLASPDLIETLHQLDTTSAALADSTKQADGTLTDVHEEVHELTHPSKKKGFVAAFEGTGDVLKHWMPALF